jgi:Protein of unknown function (DUF3723)
MLPDPNDKVSEVPDLTVDLESRKAAGRPLIEEYQEDRRSFFYEKIYDHEQYPAKEYPSSFAVMREIFFSFLGRRIGKENPSPPVTERHGEALQLLSAQASEQMLDQPDTAEAPPDGNLIIPPGTSDRDERVAPLAAGFEEEICVAPLSKKPIISVRRNARDILTTWYGSGNSGLIVFNLFESPEYYEFDADAGQGIRSAVDELSRAHHFLAVDNNGVNTLHPETNIYDKIQKTHLLVGKKDSPGTVADEVENGAISLTDLENYIKVCDIRTGKRRTEFEPTTLPFTK